jgi:class 3 adenylate cyclase/pimeloyl-ACP methyl ester carboxylesterase
VSVLRAACGSFVQLTKGASVTAPKTQYARSGDTHIAYQTLGEGPRDIVFVAPMQTNVETMWDWPPMARYLRSLSEMGRLVMFDAIGTGLSDPLPELSYSLDSWTTDVRVVMDAVGIETAVIHCFDSAGSMGMLFAATYPERVSSLVGVNTFAYLQRTDDYPIGVTQDAWNRYREFFRERWGTGELLRFFGGPTVTDADIAAYGRYERQIMAPGAAVRYIDREWATDIRPALALIRVPTLLIHRVDNNAVNVAHGRYLAERIAGVKYVELPGSEHIPNLGNSAEILDEIRGFLTGIREAPIVDRILATILFTDIVDSTRKAAEFGDRRWRAALDQHDTIVQNAVKRFDGRIIKSTGDGILATFMGPGRGIAAAKSIDEGVAGIGLTVRAGIHTGECEIRGDDIGGMAVHLAARIASLAGSRQLLVSRTVKDLVVGADIAFTDVGERELKGVPGTWQLYSID